MIDLLWLWVCLGVIFGVVVVRSLVSITSREGGRMVPANYRLRVTPMRQVFETNADEE